MEEKTPEANTNRIRVEFGDIEEKKAALRVFLDEERSRIDLEVQGEEGKRLVEWAKEMIADPEQWDKFAVEVKRENLLEKHPEIINAIREKAEEIKKEYEDSGKDEGAGKEYLRFIHTMQELLK